MLLQDIAGRPIAKDHFGYCLHWHEPFFLLPYGQSCKLVYITDFVETSLLRRISQWSVFFSVYKNGSDERKGVG